MMSVSSTMRVRLRRASWPLRRLLRDRWDQLRAPWPIVGECHSFYRPEHLCEQCQPTHVHRWKAWPKAPARVASAGGVPVRCVKCGARKCDFEDCDSRRHDHVHVAGLAFPHIKEPQA